MPPQPPPTGADALRAPRSWWDRLVEFRQHAPGWADLVWAGGHALVMGGVLHQQTALGEPLVPTLLVLGAAALVGTVALTLRSRWPLRVLGLTLLLQFVGTFARVGGPLQITVCIALFTVVLTGRPPVAGAAVLVTLAISAGDVLAVLRDPSVPVVTHLAAGWLLVSAVVVPALVLRAQLADLAHRDATLRATATLLRDRAEYEHLRERQAVANDLHDSVGHAMTAVVALAAGGARSLPEHPDEAREALRVIEQTARECLGHTREVVNRLHCPQAPGRSRRIGDIAELADTVRAAGLDVDVVQVGEPGGGAAVENACFHVAQEGLTNVLRHARRARLVTVRIGRRGRATRVEVEDDGDPRASAAPPPRHGLAGLEARVVALGGEFEAGPLPGRGWRTAATLPWTGSR